MADTEGLDPTFREKIFMMIAASHGRLHIESGYRDNALQAKLYAEAVRQYGAAGASKWVAPPGHSNHNKGLAVDLGGDIGLAHQLAAQFGLEFPMSWEPWHIEPVGIREHPATSAQAYTDGPAGSINPTQDPMINSQPSSLMAKLSAALTGAATQQVATGGMLDSASTTAAAASAGVAPGSASTTSSSGGGQMGTVALQSGQTGGDKRLPGHSIQDWAKDVLNGVGAPVTDQNMQTLITWANTESGGYNPNAPGGRYNPLNTTEGAVGYVGEGGSQGNIKDFGSYQQGVQAIVHNLTKTKGAGYENILGALRQGNDPQAVFHAINGSAFGTHF